MGNNTLQGKNIAFVVANEGVERVELTEPWEAVEEEGGRPLLIAPHPGTVSTVDHLDKSAVFEVDDTVTQTSAEEFDALVLPGGVANPDQLRLNRPAVELVRRFFELGKPVAVICHGPWTLVEADVVRGRRITSWPSLRTDIRNAGGEWVDEEVVVCTNGPNVLVSSRRPDDLKAFCGELVAQF